jgi:hypothetical protein
MRLFALSLGILMMSTSAKAQDDVYQKPSAFIAETFGGATPNAGVVDLTKERQAAIKRLIGRPYGASRVRYVVSGGKIASVKVLVYRESHGWEVRQPFFTKQFRDASLKEDGKLTARIDNIAGATLSTRALTKMAKLALYLDQHR